MADDPKPQDTKDAATADKPLWQELLSTLPKWTFWFTGIGLLITVVSAGLTAAYGTDGGQRLMNVIFRRTIPNKAKKAWRWTKKQFQLMELALFIAGNLIFWIDALLLLQFGSPHLLWVIPNTVIYRVIGGMPLILLLQVFLFFPIIRMAKWLIMVGVAEGYLRRDSLDESIVTRFIRTLSKLNAWQAVGFALAVLPPFHKWPELLAIAVAVVPIWPYFCNAWKAGDTEHLRRITLAAIAWLTVDMVLMASLHMLVKTPFLAFYNNDFQFNWIALAITVLFLIQGAGAWISGARKTAADRAWEVQRLEAIRLDTLGQRTVAVKSGKVDLVAVGGLEPYMASAAQVQNPVNAVLAPVSSAPAFRAFPDQQITVRRGLHPAITVALVVVGLFVGLYFMDPSHAPMIPSHWLYGGGK